MSIRLVDQGVVWLFLPDSRLALDHLSSWYLLNGVISTRVIRLVIQSTARIVHDEMLLGFGFVFRLDKVVLDVLRRVLEVSEMSILAS